MKRILYIGGFHLPDQNAAAQRVMGMAKAFGQLNYEVFFYSTFGKSHQIKKAEYNGFSCLEHDKPNSLDYFVSAKSVINVIRKVVPDYVIAYNYPAFALSRIAQFCSKNSIKCIADVTEWYEPHGSFFYKMVMKVDISYRMKWVHFKLDGIIAISKYLFDMYSRKVNTVLIPPLVDSSDLKWKKDIRKKCEMTKFVYAGNPSNRKEKLDTVVEAIQRVAEKQQVQFDIVGLTEEEYRDMYLYTSRIGNSIKFWGRMSHEDTLKIVKNADWTIVLRENTRLVKAGFPTKVVESISCQTPVIVNRFSNIMDYLDEKNCLVTSIDDLDKIICKACKIRKKPDEKLFDYRNYVDKIAQLLD